MLNRNKILSDAIDLAAEAIATAPPDLEDQYVKGVLSATEKDYEIEYFLDGRITACELLRIWEALP